MTYPPQFSSTLTYANRYDLDEIDVFLEGDHNMPMFFSITGLPDKLSFGKHYFNLSLLYSQSEYYKLRDNSRILFEFKSINDVVLKSDVTDLNQKNGIATCFVEVLKDPYRTYKPIFDGEGTLTVVASVEEIFPKNPPTQIPENFKGAMNYRCTFPIEIRKNLLNADSPRVLQSGHKLSTTKGQFSFAKASISSRRNTPNGMTYDGLGLASSTNTQTGATD